MATIIRRTTPYVLSISKLKDIINILRQYNFSEAKWFELGLELGLLQPTLAAIEAGHGGNIGRCLMDCLTKRLCNADETDPLTWQSLVEALKGIDEKAVAQNIHETMVDPASQILQRYCDGLSRTVFTEQTVQLLHTENVISLETMLEVESCGGKMGDSMRVLCFTVAQDHNKLRLLVDILLNAGEAVSIANEIKREYEKIFGLTSLPPTKSSSTLTGRVVSDETVQESANNTTQVVIPLCRSELVEFDRMRNELGRLLNKVAPLFKDQIPLADLKTFVRRCRPELKPQLNQAETFDNVMEIIEEKCSLINFTLVECIANEYSIEDAKTYILLYSEKLDKFCDLENSLRLCNNSQLKTFSLSHLMCETIKFTLDWEIDEHKLNDIRDLLTKTFRKLADRVEVVLIKNNNSITVTCYAPRYLMESLLITAQENLHILKDMGLISLIIGYYTLYSQEAKDNDIQVAIMPPSNYGEIESQSVSKKEPILSSHTQVIQEHLTIREGMEEGSYFSTKIHYKKSDYFSDDSSQTRKASKSESDLDKQYKIALLNFKTEKERGATESKRAIAEKERANAEIAAMGKEKVVAEKQIEVERLRSVTEKDKIAGDIKIAQYQSETTKAKCLADIEQIHTDAKVRMHEIETEKESVKMKVEKLYQLGHQQLMIAEDMQERRLGVLQNALESSSNVTTDLPVMLEVLTALPQLPQCDDKIFEAMSSAIPALHDRQFENVFDNSEEDHTQKDDTVDTI